MQGTQEMTVLEVIQKSKKQMEAKEIKPRGKYYYLRRYKDGLGILTCSLDKNYYTTDMFNLYGPFETTKQALAFLRVIRTHIEAHSQAMHNSWKEEKDTFRG